MIKKPKASYVKSLGIVSPAGLGMTPLWKSCLEGKSLANDGLGVVTVDTLNKIKQFVHTSSLIINKPDFFSKSLYFSLYCIEQAFLNSDWKDMSSVEAIFIGSTTGMLNAWEGDLLEYIAAEDKQLDKNSKFTNDNPKQSFGYLGSEIKKAFNIEAEVFFISSACSASTQAFAMAHNALTSNRYKRVLVGGVEELGQLTIKGFSSLKLLSQKPCRPFDKERSGINLTEGSAFFALDQNEENSQRGLLKIWGGETVLDSYHMTSPHPEAKGFIKSIEKLFSKLDFNYSDIDLIHAHGTGSFHNDKTEAYGIHHLFGKDQKVLSTKGTHGHALAASGAIELAICSKMLEENIILQNTGLETHDEELQVDISKNNKNTKLSYILKSTLGFGGVNSVLLLESIEEHSK